MHTRPIYRHLGIFVFLGFLAYHSPVVAKPAITWSEFPLSLTVAAGAATSARVELSVNRDLNDVRVSVSRVWCRHGRHQVIPSVSVFPNKFDTLITGETKAVSLWISVPADTPLGTCKGRVRIRSGKWPRAMPLPFVVDVTPLEPLVEPDGLSIPSDDRIVQDEESGVILVEDEIMITLEPTAEPSSIQSIANAVGGQVVGGFPERRRYQLRVPVDNLGDLQELIESARSITGVAAVHGHYFTESAKDSRDGNSVSLRNSGTCNEFSGMSWDERNPGGCNWGHEMINLPSAWDYTTGKAEVKIAVVDTGLFENDRRYHADFYQDHNNLLDVNIAGVSLTNVNSNLKLQEHGTSVTGVVAAKGNNMQGITGTMWNAGVLFCGVGRLHPFLKNLEIHDDALIEECFEWAKEEGARVINVSIGEACTRYAINEFSWYCGDKTDVWESVFGTTPESLIVVAAGNQSINIGDDTGWTDNYFLPANFANSFDNVIAVGAATFSVTPEGDVKLWEDSNYGQGVTIAAPGDGIVTLLPNDEYGGSSGTSFAAPFVSGVAGLMLSVNDKLSAQQLKGLLEEGAERGGRLVTPPNNVPSDYVLDAYVLNACESVRLAMEEKGTLPPTAFSIGDVVEVTENNVDVRAAPYGEILGYRSTGARGEVVGDAVCTAGSLRWKVDFGGGLVGWVAEEFLQAVGEPPANQDPVAEDDTVEAESGVALQIDVLANDSDADGDTLTVSSVTDGASGSTTTDGTSVTYTSNTDFAGTDGFTYTVSDGHGGTATATVTVEVTAAPAQPTASLTATPESIASGESATLSWSSTNADTCAGTSFSTGGSTSGSVSVAPVETTMYGITCTGPGGASDPVTATVTVTAAPPVITFSIDPSSATVGEGAGSVSFTVTRSDNTASQTVYVSTVENQGFANVDDYMGRLDEPLSFAIGQSQQPVTLTINPDDLTEGDETFSLIVQQSPSDPTDTFLASATFTIIDDDSEPPPSNTLALNDTGITQCANATSNELPCPVAGFPGQDAEYGRDATDNDDSDGHAGFSFTKLDADGNDLPASATEWSCVRDNVTGYVWEVKTDEFGLRNTINTYTWYNPDASTNGGNPGTQNGGNCVGGIACDTYSYVQAVNAQGLCGANDWYLPDRRALLSIVSNDRYEPSVDSDYFPSTLSSGYWSSSPYADNVGRSWLTGFGFGDTYASSKADAGYVRLVRAGQ